MLPREFGDLQEYEDYEAHEGFSISRTECVPKSAGKDTTLGPGFKWAGLRERGGPKGDGQSHRIPWAWRAFRGWRRAATGPDGAAASRAETFSSSKWYVRAGPGAGSKKGGCSPPLSLAIYFCGQVCCGLASAAPSKGAAVGVSHAAVIRAENFRASSLFRQGDVQPVVLLTGASADFRCRLDIIFFCELSNIHVSVIHGYPPKRTSRQSADRSLLLIVVY